MRGVVVVISNELARSIDGDDWTFDSRGNLFILYGDEVVAKYEDGDWEEVWHSTR